MQRIELLASLAKGSNSLLDLGCDHAYVLIEAIKKYDVKQGIASDISNGPLKMAKDSIIKANLDDKIEIILSDGFQNVNSYFDTCIIAGMGGLLIKDIIEKGLSKLDNKKLILEPNNKQYELRKYLNQNGFKIIDEYSILDQNKYYEIIVVIKQQELLSEFELKYGPILLQKRDEVFLKYYQDKYNFLNNIYKDITDSIERNNKIELLNDYKNILEDNYGEKIHSKHN